jgi:hypothetical protein
VPTLITHYIINDPNILETDADAGYVPLGHLETLEDPRLVRIGHYEDGVSGRHDASKVLTPFLESFVTQRRRQRLAVWLYDAASLNKLSQSVLEMLRAGIQDLAVDVTVFYTADTDLDDAFMQPLPIALQNLRKGSMAPGKAFVQALGERDFDYAGAVRVVWHVPGRGSRQCHIAADERAARRGVGKPPAVAERHRSVLSSSLQPQSAAGVLQLRRQPSC